ncbi:hypothetical protein AB0M92_18765 [Streptomyces sp. NPDC051582]|uniref:hypothetical protein n=1 Tax=Streptomyces sp. NPDC051582 TaxID=3155167 RepID=UPI0034338D30
MAADLLAEVQAQIKLLRNGLNAAHEMSGHVHQAFGGWEECAPCEKANDECDNSFACDSYKRWQREYMAGLTSRAELTVERLGRLIAERDEQIAYLIAAEPTLDDDQPGAPR